jgi:hypothetical protein
MNAPLSSEEAFFAEGLRVYFDASVTLRSFRQRVYATCSRVLLEHRAKFAGVGFEWRNTEMKSKAYPGELDDRQWEDEVPVLCVRAPVPSLGDFYVGVYWARNDEGAMVADVYAGLDLGSAATRERVWKAFSALGEGTRMERDPDLYEIYLNRRIEPPSEAVLVEKLREILAVWEGLLKNKNIGGFKGLRKIAGK